MKETAGAQPVTSWFTQLKPNPNAEQRLFCFPYAGGGAASFRRWPRYFSTDVELYTAQLPGRGRRLREPPIRRLPTLVENIVHALHPYLDRSFALFGHSMGAIVAFELARRLRKEQEIAPVHLFVSGYRAPQIPRTDGLTYNLPDAEFVEEVRLLNGTPAEVLEHPELMELMLPLLRADFELVETYNYSAEPPLDCPISAYGGSQDPGVKVEHLQSWREQTSARFTWRTFTGDHFFIHQAEALLLQTIDRELHQNRQRQ